MIFKKKIKIIAEAGVNPNGYLKRAKLLIKAVKKSNANYVKFKVIKISKTNKDFKFYTKENFSDQLRTI